MQHKTSCSSASGSTLPADVAHGFRATLRCFIISFFGTFFVLSLMVMATVLWCKPYTRPQPSRINGSIYLPQAEDCFTVVAAGIPPSGLPQTFMLLKFSPVDGQIPLLTFCGSVQLTYLGRPQTISDIYTMGQIEAVKDALYETFGIAVDRWAAIPAEGFVKLVDLIGYTKFSLKKDLRYTQGDISVTLGKGIQQIDGKKAYFLSTRPDQEEQERCRTVSSLAQEAINQHIELVLSPMAQRLFTGAVSLMETDITVYDYEEHHRAAEFLAQLKPLPAVAVYPPMTYQPDSQTYTLTQEGYQTICRIFCPHDSIHEQAETPQKPEAFTMLPAFISDP